MHRDTITEEHKKLINNKNMMQTTIY